MTSRDIPPLCKSRKGDVKCRRGGFRIISDYLPTRESGESKVCPSSCVNNLIGLLIEYVPVKRIPFPRRGR